MWSPKKAGAAPDPGEALRSAIRERVATAVAGELEPSGATAEEVQRLTQLLAAYEQTRPPRGRRGWPVVALVVAIAIGISVLLFLRVPTTDVTLALDLSSLGFRIGNDPDAGAERVDLVDRLLLTDVAIDGVDAIELEDMPIPITAAADFALRMNGEGSISLRPLAVPVGTWVRVDRPDASGALTLELAHPEAELEVALTLPPQLEVRPPDSALARALDGSSEGQRVVFRATPPDSAADCARLRLRWRGPAPPAPVAAAADLAPFQGALPVDALLLTDLAGGAQRTRFSTVLGGALYLETVAGREVALRRHQLLEVGLGPDGTGGPTNSGGLCAAGTPAPSTAPGRLWRVAVGREAIALQGEATVSRLSTGTAAYRQDLMPRWLEWLQTRQELLLFWGAFGSLFGLAYTVLLWWRGMR